MRFSTSAVLSAATALLHTSATVAAAGSSSASIYTFSDNSNTHHDIASLSEEETRLVFASRLGLSRFHTIGGNVDASKLQSNQKSLWVDQYGKDGSVVVTVGGVVDTEVLPKAQLKYTVSDSPSSSSFGKLLKSLEAQSEAHIDTEHIEVYTNSRGSFIDVVSPAAHLDIYFESDLPNNWEHFEKLVGKDAASLFKSDVTIDVDFFEEYMLLQELSESTVAKVIAEKATMFVYLVSLEGLYKAYGVSSKQYKTATKLFAKALTAVSSKVANYSCIVAIIPPSTRVAKREFLDSASPLKARSAGAETLLTFPPVATAEAAEDTPSPDHPYYPPVPTNGPIAACFTTELACRRGTNNCSSRGTCFKSAVEYQCWSCACVPTSELVNATSGGKGNKTTYWGGSACQKKDVSTPFWLFFGFGVTILVILVSVVSMMMSMGSEELPGALSAGVSYKRS